MNNKIFAAIALAALAAAPLAADAGSKHDDRRADYRHDHGRHDHDNRARARVVHVDPIYERVRYSVPVEHCWNETVRHVHGGADRTGAALVGGAVGAVIGNRVGNGQGVATVAGAIAGAAIGSELARDGRREVHHDRVRRCEVRQEIRHERRVVAYHVTYEFKGRRDVARLAYDPGRYVAIADVRRRG
jgi:uncharacterized protein YcfJ